MDDEQVPLLGEISQQPHTKSFPIVSISIAAIGILISIQSTSLSPHSMRILGIFIVTMLHLIFTKHEISLVVIIGLSLMIVVGMHCDQEICSIKDGFDVALKGFSDPTVWMIFAAFHLGTAVKKTGLGHSIALFIVSKLGFSKLGLGYAVFFAELILAPFIPSNTARGGGVILPVIISILDSLDSSPANNQNVGKFLLLCANHANLLTSSMFLTAAAPNPILAKLSKEILNTEVGFSEWIQMSIVPALACFLLLPIVFQWYCDPTYDSTEIVQTAKDELSDLKITFEQIKLCIVLVLLLIFWITEPYTKIPSTLVTFLGLTLTLVLNILEWPDISQNSQSWDTFFWLSIMLTMANQLNKFKITEWLSSFAILLNVFSSKLTIAILISIMYFYSMIFFSSITAHSVALAGPFMTASKDLGCSPKLIVNLLLVFSSLAACMTPYSTGSVVLFFGQGFFSRKEWSKIGFGVASIYLVVYFTLGLLYWKILDGI